MAMDLHHAVTDALETIKAGGLIRKYSLTYLGRSEAPRITIWKAADVSDDELRRKLVESLAGLAAESQLTIEKD
ncbi:hypothetical protein [Bradyrhizobium sp. ARR65]|uniref:hypothetical protein n=1 Tax=Bradyrhizobium sp. ARR65 TaxID=1040989 RepID=UPI0004654C77|nr:hypothetical protein [Bradyrhizobium sp. ARR65]